MATLTQETGTGSSTANTYVLAADLTTYTDNRSVTLGLTNGDASELLIKAMDYIESKMFDGFKGTETQALQWPRQGVYVDGYSIESDTIPTLLKEAQMEAAISIDSGTNPLDNIPRETRKEKVGDIEVEYSPSASNRTYLKAVETKLQKLLVNNGALGAIRV